MGPMFVDTSAWDAIEDSGDRHHAAALRFKEELAQQHTPLYVTNFVLDECYTLLLSNVGYTRTIAFKRTIDLMRASGILVVVHNADKIVVLEYSRIVDVGKHTGLLTRQGVYARLYTANYGLSQDSTAVIADNGVSAPTPVAYA